MLETVAIQGEAGSFSHAAAIETHGRDLRLVPCPTFVELFRAVEAGDASRGVVPIENTLAGSVHENYDLLSAHALHVVGETELRIRHCLIAPPRVTLPEVRRVASHPVALAQCRRFFVTRSEEHTSELQSHSFISYAVFCLKKKKQYHALTRAGLAALRRAKLRPQWGH